MSLVGDVHKKYPKKPRGLGSKELHLWRAVFGGLSLCGEAQTPLLAGTAWPPGLRLAAKWDWELWAQVSQTTQQITYFPSLLHSHRITEETNTKLVW